MDALSTKLNELSGDLQAILKQSQENKQAIAAVQRQCDAIDEQRQKSIIGGGGGARSGLDALVKQFSENKDFLEKSGHVRFEIPTLLPAVKTTVLSTGLVAPQQVGLEPGARPDYLFRSVLRSYPTTAGSVFRVRETAIAGAASPVVEGGAKWEVSPTLSGDIIPVQVVAGYCTCSRQILDDLDGFRAYLEQMLLSQLEAKVEAQLLLGDGVSPNLDSVTNNAMLFSSSYLPAGSDGWEYADVLHAAGVQLGVEGYRCDTFVVSPLDWAKIETCKDTTGRYIVGNPKGSLARVLWNRVVVESPALTEGSFIALDSRRFHIRQRMTATIDLSFEHSDNFTRNAVTCRCEERLALVVAQPYAAILGSFSQSPA